MSDISVLKWIYKSCGKRNGEIAALLTLNVISAVSATAFAMFSISAQRVNNPTPPGTGVTCLPSVLMQSPTNLPSALKLMPTSITGI